MTATCGVSWRGSSLSGSTVQRFVTERISPFLASIMRTRGRHYLYVSFIMVKIPLVQPNRIIELE